MAEKALYLATCFPVLAFEKQAVMPLLCFGAVLKKNSSSNSLSLQAINVVLIEINPFLQAAAIVTHKR